MVQGFTLETILVDGIPLRVRHGGAGPPLLLLHGHPRTHTTWHRVAPLLADQFTVVCPDLPGFGQSQVGAGGVAASSKRAKGSLLAGLMETLGHMQFALAGHDRGSYTAFRLAMDHPDRVSGLVIMDGVPIAEALDRCDARFATLWWHWFFYARPDVPERAIMADPEAWYQADSARMGAANHADFRAAIHDPAVVGTMLDDYRAGLEIDQHHDRADRAAGRRLACPLHLLWSLRDDMELLYGDPRAVWRPWAGGPVTGEAIDSGHHMAEEAPEAVAKALSRFLAP